MEGFDIYTLLADEIGEDAAQKVFRLFSGSPINFPKKVSIFFRDLEICEHFNHGETYDTLSMKYNLSERQIRNITSRSSESKRQEILKLLDQNG